LDHALQGAADSGAEVEKIRLSALNISGCTECNDCYETGECSTADDMDKVYEALEGADRIILASPVFFMGLPSQTKAMIDRTQRYWALKYILHEPFPHEIGSKNKTPRYGAFIGIGATKGKSLFNGINLTLKYFFDAIDVEPREELYVLVRGVEEKGEVQNRKQELDAAYETGKALALL